MHINSLYEEFLSYLDLERGYSALTITAYRSDCRLFLRALKRIGCEPDVEAIDRQVIRQYVAELRTSGLKSSSVARRLNSLRSFWKYLRDNDYAQHDPFLRISLPKRPRTVPVYLTGQECIDLLRATQRQRSEFARVRDKAILSLLLFTGLRRAELLALRLRSVDLDERTVRVDEGKGRKSRVIPLADPPILALQDWLAARPEVDHDYLFTSRCRTKLGRKALMTVLERALRNARLDRPGVTLHTLRHSFACLMLQGGCDLFSLSQMLGHTRLDTTAIYLHATVDDLRRGMVRHPLNQDVKQVEQCPHVDKRVLQDAAARLAPTDGEAEEEDMIADPDIQVDQRRTA
jgi:site-specific recombinase XerD